MKYCTPGSYLLYPPVQVLVDDLVVYRGLLAAHSDTHCSQTVLFSDLQHLAPEGADLTRSVNLFDLYLLNLNCAQQSSNLTLDSPTNHGPNPPAHAPLSQVVWHRARCPADE